MNTSAKGNGAERRVGKWLEGQDYIVGSRRHIEGPGDWTANRLGDTPLLVEVKASSVRRGPYADFPPKDRVKLRLAAIAAGMVPVLAWSPSPTKPPRLYGPKEWPG